MKILEQTKNVKYSQDQTAGRKLRTGLCFLLFLLVFWTSAARIHAGEAIYIDEDSQQLFTSENGLPGSAIVAVAQTPEGFIWLGGYGASCII